MKFLLGRTHTRLTAMLLAFAERTRVVDVRYLGPGQHAVEDFQFVNLSFEPTCERAGRRASAYAQGAVISQRAPAVCRDGRESDSPVVIPTDNPVPGTVTPQDRHGDVMPLAVGQGRTQQRGNVIGITRRPYAVC